MEQGTIHISENYGKLPLVTRWILEIAVVAAAAMFTVWCFGMRASVSGHSMEPLVNDGEQVLLNKLEYRLKEISRFDVVSFSYGEGVRSIKRVIGLPGDVVQIKNGSVYINGDILDPEVFAGNYTVAGLAEDEVVLGSDEYFLLGDNGDSSEDSRFGAVGNVSAENIEGKVWFIISPFARMGALQ